MRLGHWFLYIGCDIGLLGVENLRGSMEPAIISNKPRGAASVVTEVSDYKNMYS